MVAGNSWAGCVPGAPGVGAGVLGGGPPADSAPRIRAIGWVYALLLLLLCAEWVVRRRVGLR